MKKEILQLNRFATKENTVESYVCFKKFIDFLEEKVALDKTARVQFYKIVLDKLHAIPELAQNLSTAKTTHYDDILELIAAIVLPLAENEEESLVALGNGASPEVFYATPSFYQLFDSAHSSHLPQEWLDEKMMLEQHSQIQYNIILRKIYGYSLPEKEELVYSFFNPVTKLNQYYRLNVDTRFVDVSLRAGMHRPCVEAIDSCMACTNSNEAIQGLLPLDHFIASGFSIITLTDVTVQQATEQIGRAIVNTGPERADDMFEHTTRLLQTIAGSSQYQFGLMPFFSINGRAALPYENFTYSIMVKASFDAGISKKVFTRYINHYLKNPDWIEFHSSAADNTLPVPVQNALVAAGIHYYALAPVYFNSQLLGILETAAGKDVAPMNELQASRLKPALPYLSQLLQMIIEKFNVSIDTIIKDKFTNIQPSVQWKFTEVAWHYFRSHNIEHKDAALEKITFKEVFPLYGAVDIRNSTIERNKVLREDLDSQLQLLISLLNMLFNQGYGNHFAELSIVCRQWIDKMLQYVSVEEEQELSELLYQQVHPHLSALENLPVNLEEQIKIYFSSIDKETGFSFKNRRQLENSMQMINRSVGQYFDLFKDELQSNYPCYFEKFRTDGVEYDIYIGQSIAPKIPFTAQHLETLRLWQVQSMAAITKLTHALQSQLEHPLQTTQLIFVNARAIDISFRNDERRFDVEGAYNIRYHIVKKRIDKVHILGTAERLTQPGKIAIVYFNEKDAAGYKSYIRKLQQEGILLDDLEYLDLEEMQGVAGLKSLRVGVNLQDKNTQ